MTDIADLDRTIVAWLRDGETVAPSRLAADVRLAVRLAPVPRGSLVRLPWTLGRRRRPRVLALVLAGAAGATALFGLLWASGSTPRPKRRDASVDRVNAEEVSRIAARSQLAPSSTTSRVESAISLSSPPIMPARLRAR